ncbi:MAG TPA: tetratricopeptide repeat protein, partial [Chloroflexi bacterium]|nr:tetratricopeptide repeat protein [Chloroflexota bacterium]
LIDGEAGVGKTRLAEEFVVWAALEGARVARGQCISDVSSAYHPWREILRVLIHYVEGMEHAELDMNRVGPILGTLLPELWEREDMAGLAPPVELNPSAARLRLNAAIASLLQAIARVRPTVLVIEDAHWADEATLELLRYLTHVSDLGGVLVCVTYREDGSAPADFLAALSGDSAVHISLHPLSPELSNDLVSSMLGLDRLPASLVERVQRATGGNAFFVQELIRSLAEDGRVLQRTVTGWAVDAVALQDTRLPDSIRQVAGRRLEHLSPETRQVLQWAAVVGARFWDGVLKEMSRASREQVQAALSEGLERELIFERDTSAFEGQREFLFAKPAVREVSYETVPEPERQIYHDRAATWLLSHSDERDSEHLGLIADHLERAGRAEQATTYWRQAGERAAFQFANAEALAYLTRALNLVPEDDAVERYWLLSTREKVYGLQGRRDRQLRDLQTLEELAASLDDAARQAEVALRWAAYSEATGDYPGAIGAAQNAIAFSQATQDVACEANGYQKWGFALWRQGNYAEAHRRLERALALAREVGERQIEALSLRDLGVVFSIQGGFARGLDYTRAALEIFRETGNRPDEGLTLNNMGVMFSEQGDYLRAIDYFEQTVQVAREIGDRLGETLALANLGGMYTSLGDLARGRAYYEQALHMSREIGDRMDEGLTLSNLGLLFHFLGDDESALGYARQAVRVTQEIGAKREMAYAQMSLGEALIGLGCLVKAAEAYQVALTLWHELGQSDVVTSVLAGLARVSLAQGDLTQAQVYVEDVLERLDELEGRDEFFYVSLTCYQVLQARQDPRARDVLETAYRSLQDRAAKIADETWRRSFLENSPVNREIVQAFESLDRE